ncbi:MAG: carbohydrate ABC transporter permease [Clostridiales bacterium]|jgi:putative aldouronate transport system permease protein|nr:carbohydrate ABC transporter permease [Clostridiales bacterium]
MGKNENEIIRKKKKKKTGDIIFDTILAIILGIIGISMLYPFIYVLAVSFNHPADTELGGIWLYPRVFSTEAYRLIFMEKDLFRATLLSVSRTVLGTFLTVLCSSMFAYLFTRSDFLLYKPLKAFFFFAMFFGGGGLIPTYMLYLNLNLYDTFWVYIIPHIINLWYVVLFRTYFKSVPADLLEAAKIDGAHDLKVFFKILMPVSKPIYATVALYSAVMQWNSYRDTLYYTTDPKLRTLQYICMQMIKKAEGEKMIDRATMFEIFHGEAVTADPLSLRMAITVVTVVPIICVYPFLQKYFVKGIMVGSMKG